MTTKMCALLLPENFITSPSVRPVHNKHDTAEMKPLLMSTLFLHCLWLFSWRIFFNYYST